MVTKILHTGFEVADLDQAVRLYTSLGFEVVNRFHKPEPGAEVATVSKADTSFELWQFEDRKHPQVAFIRNHIALYSDSLEEDLDELQIKGYRIVIPITEGVLLKYAFVQDSVGATYEIATEKIAA